MFKKQYKANSGDTGDMCTMTINRVYQVCMTSKLVHQLSNKKHVTFFVL